MPQPHPRPIISAFCRYKGVGEVEHLKKKVIQYKPHVEFNHCPNFFLSDSGEHTGIEVSERDMIVDITLNLLRFILRCQAFNINSNLLVTYFITKQGAPDCAEKLI